jgi:hypothetical protein
MQHKAKGGGWPRVVLQRARFFLFSCRWFFICYDFGSHVHWLVLGTEEGAYVSPSTGVFVRFGFGQHMAVGRSASHKHIGV